MNPQLPASESGDCHLPPHLDAQEPQRDLGHPQICSDLFQHPAKLSNILLLVQSDTPATAARVTAVRVEESIEIARPPHEVWYVVVDPRHDPEWCEKVKSVETVSERRWRVIHKPVPLRSAVELTLDQPNSIRPVACVLGRRTTPQCSTSSTDSSQAAPEPTSSRSATSNGRVCLEFSTARFGVACSETCAISCGRSRAFLKAED